MSEIPHERVGRQYKRPELEVVWWPVDGIPLLATLCTHDPFQNPIEGNDWDRFDRTYYMIPDNEHKLSC